MCGQVFGPDGVGKLAAGGKPRRQLLEDDRVDTSGLFMTRPMDSTVGASWWSFGMRLVRRNLLRVIKVKFPREGDAVGGLVKISGSYICETTRVAFVTFVGSQESHTKSHICRPAQIPPVVEAH